MSRKFSPGEHYRHKGGPLSPEHDIFVIGVMYEDDNEAELAIFYVKKDTRDFVQAAELTVFKSEFDQWERLDE